MKERFSEHFPGRATQEQQHNELVRLDDVEGFIWGKARQFSMDDLMLTEDLAQEAREAVFKRLRESPDCPTSHLKVKATDAVYHYRGRGSSVDGKLHPANRTKTYQISSLEELVDNDETGNGCLQAETNGEPQAIPRFTEERAFVNVMFDRLRDSLSETENQVLTLRLMNTSWGKVREILSLSHGEIARIRKRIAANAVVIWGLPATEPL
jgi:hypothetical protein